MRPLDSLIVIVAVPVLAVVLLTVLLAGSRWFMVSFLWPAGEG